MYEYLQQFKANRPLSEAWLTDEQGFLGTGLQIAVHEETHSVF